MVLNENGRITFSVSAVVTLGLFAVSLCAEREHNKLVSAITLVSAIAVAAFSGIAYCCKRPSAFFSEPSEVAFHQDRSPDATPRIGYHSIGD